MIVCERVCVYARVLAHVCVGAVSGLPCRLVACCAPVLLLLLLLLLLIESAHGEFENTMDTCRPPPTSEPPPQQRQTRMT